MPPARCALNNAVEQVEVFAVPVADIASDSLWCGDQAVLLEQAATGTGDLDFNWASTFGTQTGPTWAVPENLTRIVPRGARGGLGRQVRRRLHLHAAH